MEASQFLDARLGKVCWLPLLISSLLLPAGTSRSQQQPPITVEVKVVNVLATVRDKRGQIVSNLGKDDFELEEDGHPQTIAYFTRETELPLTLGLLVDTSLSQSRVLDQERSASHSFLGNMLREDKDKAFVIHFDREVELLQNLTSSRQKLESALDLLGAPQLVRSGNGGDNGGSRQRYGGGGTLLYDAVYLASDEVIRKQQGRKALIVLSDGVDRGSKETPWSTLSRPRSAPTQSSIRFCLPLNNNIRVHLAASEAREWAGTVAAAGTDTLRKNGPTERKFSNASPGKPAAACLRFPRSSPSTRFIRLSRKNFAISTASATRPDRMLRPAITKSISRRSRKT
jgi:Mg-chelatase subunit ChlD